ncbi:MAG: glycosyltransferase [Oligoflexales bacterium]|nr:glycosyltransferase [Oligoflexales bacterium]
MRVAYVHDWLVTYRGGEKVLEALIRLYPEAPIYTLFYKPESMPESIRKRDVRHPRGLVPFTGLRKALLPFMPALIESLPLEEYDLVISTSSCVAKGIIPGPAAKHLCYIHSPMRYIWDQRRHYLKGLQKIPLLSPFIYSLSTRLRLWDISSSSRVDRFVVNSKFIGKRVQRYYGRSSEVIHPPCELERFSPKADGGGDDGAPYFLAVGAFVSYKRMDIAIDACKKLGKNLVVVGYGPLERALRKNCGKNISFVINPKDFELVKLYQNAEALLFPALEDFGITAIEAMASGVPVIAYRGGGALDFIKPGVTGEFFDEQTSESMAGVIENFSRKKYHKDNLVSFASGFSRDVFLNKIRQEIDQLIDKE